MVIKQAHLAIGVDAREKRNCELNNAQQMSAEKERSRRKSAEKEMSVEKKCWMRSEKGC